LPVHLLKTILCLSLWQSKGKSAKQRQQSKAQGFASLLTCFRSNRAKQRKKYPFFLIFLFLIFYYLSTLYSFIILCFLLSFLGTCSPRTNLKVAFTVPLLKTILWLSLLKSTGKNAQKRQQAKATVQSKGKRHRKGKR
jgi:hypothetical protein